MRLDRHLDRDDRLEQHLAPLVRHLVELPLGLRLEPLLELGAQPLGVALRVVARNDPHRAGEMHRLIEPGRHLFGARVPVGRHIGVMPLHGDEPGPALLGDRAERIGARHMEFELRHLAVLLDQAERQVRGDRAAAVAWRSPDRIRAPPRTQGSRPGCTLKAGWTYMARSPVRVPPETRLRGFSRGMPRSSSPAAGLTIRCDRSRYRPGWGGGGGSIWSRSASWRRAYIGLTRDSRQAPFSRRSRACGSSRAFGDRSSASEPHQVTSIGVDGVRAQIFGHRGGGVEILPAIAVLQVGEDRIDRLARR